MVTSLKDVSLVRAAIADIERQLFRSGATFRPRLAF